MMSIKAKSPSGLVNMIENYTSQTLGKEWTELCKAHDGYCLEYDRLGLRGKDTREAKAVKTALFALRTKIDSQKKEASHFSRSFKCNPLSVDSVDKRLGISVLGVAGLSYTLSGSATCASYALCASGVPFSMPVAVVGLSILAVKKIYDTFFAESPKIKNGLPSVDSSTGSSSADSSTGSSSVGSSTIGGSDTGSKEKVRFKLPEDLHLLAAGAGGRNPVYVLAKLGRSSADVQSFKLIDKLRKEAGSSHPKCGLFVYGNKTYAVRGSDDSGFDFADSFADMEQGKKETLDYKKLLIKISTLNQFHSDVREIGLVLMERE